VGGKENCLIPGGGTKGRSEAGNSDLEFEKIRHLRPTKITDHYQSLNQESVALQSQGMT